MPQTVADPSEVDTDQDDSAAIPQAQPADPQVADASSAQPPAPQIKPPVSWQLVKSYPEFQAMSPDDQKGLFTRWVSNASNYLSDVNTPRPALNQFRDNVVSEGKALGVGYIFNPDGTPQTIGQRNAIMGQETDPSVADHPFTTDIKPLDTSVGATVGRGVGALEGGLEYLFAHPIAGTAAKVWDYVTGTTPGTTALDKGIAATDQINKEQIASQGGETAEQSFGNAAGQTVTSFLGGPSVLRMISLAAPSAADETYNNALDQGATPLQATASAGVAGAVSAGTLAVLGPLNKLAIGKVLGDDAEAFVNGAFRPSVAQAAKLMGLDAAGLFATGAGGQVLQNKADQNLYDPDRPVTQGALAAGAQASLFALIHAPTILKAFWDNRSTLQAANTQVANAQDAYDGALKDGDPNMIQSASEKLLAAKANVGFVANDIAKNAPDPTPQDAQEAKEIVTANPQATNPLDAAISEATQDAQKPTDVETQTNPAETAQPVPGSEAAPQEGVEPQSAEQGNPAETESSAPVAGEPAGKGTAPATYLGEQETGVGKPSIPLYNLTEDVEGHPKGSTVSADTLQGLGYDLPDKPIQFSDNPDREGFVEKDGVWVDPTTESLPPVQKAAVEVYHAALRTLGIRGMRVRIAPSTAETPHIYVRPGVEPDTINIHPGKSEFSDKSVAPTAMAEEYWHNIHGLASKKLGGYADAMKRVFGEMSPESIIQTVGSYGGRAFKDALAKGNLSDSNKVGVAAEYLRILQMRLARQKTIEEIRGNNLPDSDQTKGLLSIDPQVTSQSPTIAQILSDSTKLDQTHRPQEYEKQATNISSSKEPTSSDSGEGQRNRRRDSASDGQNEGTSVQEISSNEKRNISRTDSSTSEANSSAESVRQNGGHERGEQDNGEGQRSAEEPLNAADLGSGRGNEGEVGNQRQDIQRSLGEDGSGTLRGNRSGEVGGDSSGSAQRLVDGSEIAPNQTETPEFKKWFAGSQITDDSGNPKVLYHGTGSAGFTDFDPSRSGQRGDEGYYGRGLYFTDNPEYASQYGQSGNVRGIYPVYGKMEKPLEYHSNEAEPIKQAANKLAIAEAKAKGEIDPDAWVPYRAKHISDVAQKAGYDGIISRSSFGNMDEYAFFRPEQIKSATGNRGTFSPDEASIIRFGDEMPKPEALDKEQESRWSEIKGAFKKLGKETLTDLKEYTPRLKATMQYLRKLQQKIQNSNEVREYIRKQVPDPVARAGIARWIDAGGDKDLLAQQESQVKDKALKAEYQKAQNLTPSEEQVANKLSTLLEAKRQQAAKWGLNISKRENYFPRIVEKDPNQSNFAQTGKGINTGFSHAKERTFPTMFEGEQAGVKYKTRDAADLIAAYQNSLDHAIASRQYIADLAKGKEKDGRPVLAPPKSGYSDLTPPDGKQGIHMVFNGAPPEGMEDYESIPAIRALKGWAWAGEANGKTVLHQSDLLVHPQTAAFLKKIFGTSGIASWWRSPSDSATQAFNKRAVKFLANDLNAVAKSNLFAFSPFFHPIQIGVEAAGHGVNPTRVAKLDLNDPDVADAMDHSLALGSEDSKLNEEARSDTNKTILRPAEILADKFLGKKAGDSIRWFKEANQAAQDWIFKTYIPSIKYNTYQTALARNMDRLSKDLKSGKVNEDQVKYLTAEQVNNAYGELNYAALERHPDVQLMLRNLLLAPDFFEARARHLGQAVTGITQQAGREQFRAIASVGLAIGVSAQLTNLLINGQMDLSHPFEVRIGNRYYGVRSSPGDAAALFKDLYTLATGGTRGVPYINNRLSPMSRLIDELRSGTNWRGEKVGAGGAITDFIANNSPMMVQPFASKIPGIGQFFTSSKNNPVSPFEQVLSALGVKVSRYSPITEMDSQARDWVAKNGAQVGLKSDNTVYPVSAYRPKKYALEDGDYATAQKEYQTLLQSHGNNAQKVAQGFATGLKHPYTGSKKGDLLFYNQLDDDGKKLFQAAQARKTLLEQRFAQMRQMQQK